MPIKERPILMHARSINGILAGRKTQTRRIMSPQPMADGDGYWTWNPRRNVRLPFHENGDIGALKAWCPYGQKGDRLWIRETFYCDDFRFVQWKTNPELIPELREALEYRATHDCRNWEAGCPCKDYSGCGSWGPSIHMPRWASRLSLEITDIRVELVRDISEEDCKAEGISSDDIDKYLDMVEAMEQVEPRPARDLFSVLWNDTNGDGAWERNDWVWVVGFRRLQL